MRTALVLTVALCASLAQTAEDTWQNTCIARAKLALSLTFKWNADEKPGEFQRNAASSSLKLIRNTAVSGLISKENLHPEFQDRYEEFEYSNNAFELNRTLCKLLEKIGSDTPTKMESVRLLSSQDEAVLKKAYAGLKDAPADLIAKFKELKDTDYKRAFVEQMKLLEWAESQRVAEFDTQKIDKSDLERYSHSAWIWAHPLYDEPSLTQSMEVLYGVLVLRGDSAHKWLALPDLTFHFDWDELWNEPQLKISNDLKELKGEFWTVRGNQFWKAFNPWLDKNHSYLYFHPAEKHFRIDYAAREKNMSSKDYRSANKWRRNEGPNKIDPAKVVDYKDD